MWLAIFLESIEIKSEFTQIAKLQQKATFFDASYMDIHAESVEVSLTYMGYVFRFEDNLWKPCSIDSVSGIDFICDKYTNVIMMQEGFIAGGRKEEW